MFFFLCILFLGYVQLLKDLPKNKLKIHFFFAFFFSNLCNIFVSFNFVLLMTCSFNFRKIVYYNYTRLQNIWRSNIWLVLLILSKINCLFFWFSIFCSYARPYPTLPPFLLQLASFLCFNFMHSLIARMDICPFFVCIFFFKDN